MTKKVPLMRVAETVTTSAPKTVLGESSASLQELENPLFTVHHAQGL
jgi:hypothetical protein